MLVLTLLWILSVTTPGSCSQCRIILDVSSGLNNFDIELDPGELLNGIVTIEGVLNLKHAPESGVPHKDLLKFIGEDDSNDAPILEIETQVHRSQQCMYVRGTLNDTDSNRIVTYPKPRDLELESICLKIDNKRKISKDGLVNFQLSNIDSEITGYEVYLGGFAEPVKSWIKFASPENWQKFENRRIDGTRRIVNTCKQDCHLSYTKISVCSDPQPKLLDKMDVQVVRAELGSNYTLSCSASGAPYLGSEWRDKENSIIPGDEVFSSDGAEFHIESKLVISDVNTETAGNYTCKIFNRNFGKAVEKLVSLQYSNITALNSTYRFTEIIPLVWIVKGYPLSEVKLECKTEFGVLVHYDRRSESSPPRVLFTPTPQFFEEDAPASLSCVLLNGIKLLDHKIFRRENKDSEISKITSEPPTEAAFECTSSKSEKLCIGFGVTISILTIIIML